MAPPVLRAPVLTRPGERDANHVTPRQRGRHALDLDGRGLLDAFGLEVAQDGGRQLHVAEGGQGRWKVLAVGGDVERVADLLGV